MNKQQRILKLTAASVFSLATASTILPACEQGQMYCLVASGGFMATLEQTEGEKNCFEKDVIRLHMNHYLGVKKDTKRGDPTDPRMAITIDAVHERLALAEEQVWALEDYGANAKNPDPDINVKPDTAFLKEAFYVYGKQDTYLPDASEFCYVSEFDEAKLDIPALDGVPDWKKEEGEKGDGDKDKDKDKEDGEDEKDKDKEDGEDDKDGDKDKEDGEDDKDGDKDKEDGEGDKDGDGDGEDKDEEDEGDKEDDEFRSALYQEEEDNSLPPLPAYSVSYSVSDVKIRVSPALQGVVAQGELTYTEGDCTASYKFRAFAPQVPCESDEECSDKATQKAIAPEIIDEGVYCFKAEGADSGLCAFK